MWSWGNTVLNRSSLKHNSHNAKLETKSAFQSWV